MWGCEECSTATMTEIDPVHCKAKQRGSVSNIFCLSPANHNEQHGTSYQHDPHQRGLLLYKHISHVSILPSKRPRDRFSSGPYLRLTGAAVPLPSPLHAHEFRGCARHWTCSNIDLAPGVREFPNASVIWSLPMRYIMITAYTMSSAIAAITSPFGLTVSLVRCCTNALITARS